MVLKRSWFRNGQVKHQKMEGFLYGMHGFEKMMVLKWTGQTSKIERRLIRNAWFLKEAGFEMDRSKIKN